MVLSKTTLFKMYIYSDCGELRATRVVIHTFNPSIWETEQKDCFKFEANLNNIVSLRAAGLQSKKPKKPNVNK